MPTLRRAMELTSERGASNWLTVFLYRCMGLLFTRLHASYDAIALQYGCDLVRLPDQCPCGVKFSVEHAFSCPKGGLSIIRHNEISDLIASS